MYYLNKYQIEAMAVEAVKCYEMTASWRSAYHASLLHCHDNYGFVPRRSAVALSIRHAKIKWMRISETGKRIKESAQATCTG